MNEQGFEAGCSLGYMSAHDTRDFDGKYRFQHCKIESDPNVVIKPDLYL